MHHHHRYHLLWPLELPVCCHSSCGWLWLLAPNQMKESWEPSSLKTKTWHCIYEKSVSKCKDLTPLWTYIICKETCWTDLVLVEKTWHVIGTVWWYWCDWDGQEELWHFLENWQDTGEFGHLQDKCICINKAEGCREQHQLAMHFMVVSTGTQNDWESQLLRTGIGT